jgi:glycosyltransferase involved in cell wall biosynthesis
VLSISVHSQRPEAARLNGSERVSNSLVGLRVCFIAGTLGQGGAERQLVYILRALQETGACAEVLSLRDGEFWNEPIRRLGVKISNVGGSSSRLKRLINIRREAQRFRPHIIQAQHFYVNLYGAVVARLLGCRDIGAVRNDVTSELADLGGPLGRVSLRLPRILASNSRAATRTLIRIGMPEKKLFFLPNAIDSSHFAPGSASAEDSWVILGAGRLVRQKRFDLFLRVLTRLKLKIPVKGVIAGDGPLRSELEAEAARLGLLPDKVEFLGRVSDLACLYRGAHLLLLTSDHEGTPNTVLEAMASGVPVVATRVGDVPDLLGEGVRGRLAAPGDLEGLASATEALLTDPQARANLAKQGRAYAESEHSDGALTQNLRRLYSMTLAT